MNRILSRIAPKRAYSFKKMSVGIMPVFAVNSIAVRDQEYKFLRKTMESVPVMW